MERFALSFPMVRFRQGHEGGRRAHVRFYVHARKSSRFRHASLVPDAFASRWVANY